MQIGGSHYKAKTIEPWDFIAANNLGFFEGNIIKYLSRWRDKNGTEDLLKARHYLDKLIEIDRMKQIISMYAEQAESVRKSLK